MRGRIYRECERIRLLCAPLVEAIAVDKLGGPGTKARRDHLPRMFGAEAKAAGFLLPLVHEQGRACARLKVVGQVDATIRGCHGSAAPEKKNSEKMMFVGNLFPGRHSMERFEAVAPARAAPNRPARAAVLTIAMVLAAVALVVVSGAGSTAEPVRGRCLLLWGNGFCVLNEEKSEKLVLCQVPAARPMSGLFEEPQISLGIK